MSGIGDIPELAAEWLRTRPQYCATCGTFLPKGLPCIGCEADGWYAEAAAWYAQQEGDTTRPAPECPICHGPCIEAHEPTDRWTDDEKAEWREVFRQMMKDFDRHMAERGQR